MDTDRIKAFAHRLNQAVEQHPQVPAAPYGRQSWLVQKLKTETGLSVSNNTVNKWMRGLGTPRPDKVKALAKVLDVDEVWLGFGRYTNLSTPEQELVNSAKSSPAAFLILAGLMEISGGRAVIDTSDPKAPIIRAFTAAGEFTCIATVGQTKGSTVNFVVPEPVGKNRVVGVILDKPEDCLATARVELLDITEVARENLGGVSVAKIERRLHARYKFEGQRNLRQPVRSAVELAAP